MELEVLLGDVKVQLIRNLDQEVLFEHPCPMNATHHIQHNIISFNITKDLLEQGGELAIAAL